MLIITKENNSIKVVGQNNPTYPYSGTLVYPLNSVTVVTDQSNMAVFRSALNNDVLFTGLIDDITIAGSPVTKEDIGTKFGAISNTSSSGGGTGGGGAVDSVNGQTGTVVLTASDVNAYTKEESDGKYATKAEIPSTDNLATKQQLAGEVSEREKQDSALGGMIAGETEAREQAITNLTATVQGKLDTATYNSEKATFETKENAAATYQPKGSYLTSIPEEYVTDTELSAKNYATQDWVGEQGYLTEHQDISGLATKEELNGKQNTLVSGTNIKTINSQSLLGEGNIEITVQGGGITDAPNDGKLYGRKSEQWTEVVIPDTSNLATKAELGAKLDTATYNEEKATFALKTEIPNISNLATKTELTEGLAGKANTSDLSDYLTTANAQSTYATKSELGAKLDVETYNSDKATFALKSELPDTSDFITKATADETYQPKGEYLTSIPENYVTDEELNGKGYATTAQLNAKQDTLVSGTNIKTVNGNSLLGSGDITIEGGGSGIATWDYAQLQSDQEYRTNFLSHVKVSDDLINLGGSDNPEHASILTIDNNVYTVMYNVGGTPKVTSINIQESGATITNIDAIPKNVATTTENGLMSSADKTKLDSIDIASILSRIAALETQMGEVSAKLDKINGETI